MPNAQDPFKAMDDALTVQERLIEQSLAMRAQAYMAEAKAKLLTQTLMEMDSAKERLPHHPQDQHAKPTISDREKPQPEPHKPTASTKDKSSRNRYSWMVTLILIITMAAVSGMLLYGLEGFRRIQTFHQEINQYQQLALSRAQVLSRINQELGYGGFIHHFKNYVLRGQPHYYDRVQAGFERFEALTSHYYSLAPSPKEIEAMGNFTQVIEKYKNNVHRAYLLVKRGADPKAVDKVVKIDDAPAITAMRILTDSIDAFRTEKQATTMASLHTTKSYLTWSILLLPATILMGLFTAYMLRRIVLGHNRTLQISSQLETILQATPDAMLTLREDGQILRINHQACELFDMPQDELLGQSVKSLFGKQSSGESRSELFESLLANDGAIHTVTMEIHTPSDRYFPAEITSNVTVSEQGTYRLLIIRDVSERRRYEEALKASEKRFRRAVIQSPAPIMLHASDGEVLEISQSWTHITGYTHAAIPTIERWAGRAHPEESQNVIDGIRNLHRHKGQQHEGEFTIRTQEGSQRIWDFSSAPLGELPDGRRAVISMAVDITDRKQAEQERNQAHNAQVVINRLLKIALQPMSFTEQLQSALSEVLSLPWLTLLDKGGLFIYDEETQKLTLSAHHNLEPILLQSCNKVGLGHCLCGQAAEQRQTIYASHVDERHHIHYPGMADHGHYAVPILSRNTLLGVLILYLNPGHCASDEELRYIEIIGQTLAGLIERRKLDDALHQAKEQAEAANQAKSDFLANMSHEIRTPLNAVLGLGHLLENTPLNAKQTDYLTKINASAQSLLGVINDVLDFSKIESGKLILESTEFRLDDVLDQLSNILSVKAEEKGLELLFHICDKVPRNLIGDPLRLSQVLINLGTNAVKFTERGEVVISADTVVEDGEHITLTFSVRDTGIGLSDDQLDYLFQSFSQADSSTTRKYGGSGLGLAICRQLSTLMGGEIWAESKPEIGSTFTFTADFKLPKDEGRWCIVPGPEVRGKKVLVVDDNSTAREILSEFLNSMGFVVGTAASGPEALQTLAKASHQGDSPYDVVCMDWKMPDMNGLQAIEKMRDDKAITQPAACIMVSAYGREEMREQVEAGGVDTFLSKPVTPSILLDAILDTFAGTSEKQHHTHHRETNTPTMNRFLGARVLLVEDNHINQQVALEILSATGMQVEVCENGQQAVDLIAEGDPQRFHAILMDLQMPVMDGFAATHTIKQRWPDQAPPIIAMTANAMTQDIERCHQIGMAAHIAKPIDVPQMLSTLEEHIPTLLNMGPQTTESHLGGAKHSTLDISEGITRLNNNLSLYKQLLVELSETYAQSGQQLEAHLQQQDFIAARSISHAIKGLAGNLSAKALHHAATKLEQACIQKNEPQCQLWLTTFQEAWPPLLNAISELTGGTKTVPEPSTSTTHGVTLSTDLHEKLQQLKELLDNMDMAAEQLMVSLQPQLQEAGLEPLGQRWMEQISKLDYAEAAQGLSAVLSGENDDA
ncbi:response regulator [Magnetococcus sp. PR-3]|uniref:response regulator n=1 Tax=Magnetococcus sp. PR-3 TaxID=3120355 RepID=UPI002FCE4F0A